MAIIFELIILAILAAFVVLGARRGLVLTLCGLLGVGVAFIGASLVAGALSPMVADALEPRFAAAIEEQLNQSIQHTQYITDQGGVATVPEEVPLSGVLDALRDMGLYEGLIDSVNQAVENGMTEVAASAAAKVAATVAQSVAYRIIYMIGFVVILILWKWVSRTLNLVARLPVLHQLNHLLGGAAGLLQGCIILFIAAWVIQFMGNLIPAETVKHTVLLKFFMTTNPMSLLFGL